MKLRYSVLFSALVFWGWPILSDAQTPASSTIEANNVKAVVNANGATFTNGLQGQFIPLEPGLVPKTLLDYSGIWLAGLDPAFNLKGAVSLSGASDFQPGLPGNPIGEEWNNIWTVSCADINQHLDDLEDNGVVDNPNAQVFGFPGKGNPYFEQYNPYEMPFMVQSLAGFHDKFSDGQYNPDEGDYPVIEVRGCPLGSYPEEMNWFAFNDFGTHPSGMAPLQVEVQTQFFAFKTPTPSLLNNAIFVRYKIINRAVETLDSCFFGVYADFDIGNPNDDFIGVIPAHNIMYGYNGDNNDAGGFGSEIPVMAIDMLRGPLDENAQEIGLNSALVLGSINSLNPVQYYYLLSGSLPDGSPAPNGGIMFPGNPNNAGEISEVTAGNTPGERVGLVSYGPFKLSPGAVNELIIGYYYVHTAGATPLQNVQTLYDQAAVVQGYFDNCFIDLDNTCDLVSNVASLPNASDLRLFPNPAKAGFTIESEREPFSRIEMTDMLGRTLKQVDIGYPAQQYFLNTNDLPSGMYRVRVGGQVLPVVVNH